MSSWKDWKDKMDHYSQTIIRSKKNDEVRSYRSLLSGLYYEWWIYTTCMMIKQILTQTTEDSRIADIGCGYRPGIGPGPLTIPLAEEGREVVGIDPIADHLLAIGRELSDSEKGHVNLVCCVCEYLPIRGECFDVAICSSTLEHMIWPKRALDEIHRILKSEGLLSLKQGFVDRRGRYLGFLSRENPSHLRSFSYRELSSLLRGSGFEFVLERRIGFRPLWLLLELPLRVLSLVVPELARKLYRIFFDLQLSMGDRLPNHSFLLVSTMKKKERSSNSAHPIP